MVPLSRGTGLAFQFRLPFLHRELHDLPGFPLQTDPCVLMLDPAGIRRNPYSGLQQRVTTLRNVIRVRCNEFAQIGI